jgi:hypothetical protein
VLNVSPHGNPHLDHFVARDWRIRKFAVFGLRIPFDHDDEGSTDRLSIPSPRVNLTLNPQTLYDHNDPTWNVIICGN